MYNDNVEWNDEKYSITVESGRIVKCAILEDHGWEDVDLGRQEAAGILESYEEGLSAA